MHNPWLTTGLLKSSKTKSRLYQLFFKRPTQERESNYKKLKNILTCLIYVARRNYYDKKLDMARSNLKQTLKILNEVINRQNVKAPSVISNPVDIANDFCDNFTNITSNLSSKILPTNSSPNDFLCRSLSESILLQPLTVIVFSNIVKSFSVNKAPGHDNISMEVIHQSLKNIVQSLVSMINLLLPTGVFPEYLKIAKVIPFFKADDPTLFSNYRPMFNSSSFF